MLIQIVRVIIGWNIVDVPSIFFLLFKVPVLSFSSLKAFQKEMLLIFATTAKKFEMNGYNRILPYNKSLSGHSHTGGDLTLIFQ